jgi:predicted porin
VAGPVAADTPPLVASGQDRVKLTISGLVHRAVNVAYDGDKTKIYHVDPVAANSRFRLVGSAEVTDDIEIGTEIEVGVAPNSSERVSQDNEDAGDKFDLRIVEAALDSKRYGKLTIGKGSAASDNTAQVDLSGTNVVLYSSATHPVSGLKFVEKDGELTDVKIGDVFDNFDGLGRESRIQYDSPKFAGFSFGTTYADDQRADAALRWAAEIGDFKAAAAGSIFDPSKDDVDYGLAASASILHQETGLNLTVAGGEEKTDSGGDRYQLYLKGGWIADFFDFGSSHFGLHGARTGNLPTSGDEGWTLGTAFVQRLEDFGIELYTKLSVYDLDRDNDPSVDQILALTFGSRIKF